MTFIILAVLAFLIVLVFRKYRSVVSTVIAILLTLGITSAVLAAGIIAFRDSNTMEFFNSSIGHRDFIYLIAAWYGADVFCSILIIRNHIAYRKVNTVIPKN